MVDPLGRTRSTSYTTNNEVTTYTDANTQTSTLNWASGGNLTSIQQPAESGHGAATTYFDYTGGGGAGFLPSSSTDAQGHCSSYTYDAKGNMLTSTAGLSSTAQHTCTGSSSVKNTLTYNSNGTVSSVKDPNGNFTYYTYGAGNYNLAQVQEPGANCATDSTRKLCTDITVDGLSRITSTRNGNNMVTRYSYDELDRVTEALFGGATTCTSGSATCISYTYDAEGNLTKRIDDSGTTTFSYDLLNRPKTKVIPSRPDVTTGFDGAGNLVSYADGAASATTYGYNAANQLTAVTDPAGAITITPDVNGRRKVVAYPNGVSVTYGYTNAGQLKTASYSGGTGLPPSSTYSYSVGTADTGVVQSRTWTGGTTTGYSYDLVGRLAGTTESSTAVTNYGYGYDNNSNLVRKTSTTNGVSGSSCGRYTPTNSFDGTGSVTGTSCTGVTYSTTWSFDNAGNQISSSSGWAESYNAKNQLTSATAPGGSAVAMSYAAATNSERISAGVDNLAEGALGVTVRTNTAGTTRYTRAPDGSLLDERTPAGTFYYLLGSLGSTEGLVDSTGATVASYSYDPYGNTLSATGTQAADNPWRFTGGYYDNEGDGLYHFGERYYDRAGHWTQQDRLAGDITQPGSVNRYLYAGANPANLVDPSGQDAFSLVIGIFGVLAFVGTIGAAVATAPLIVGAFTAGAIAFGAAAAVGGVVCIFVC